MQPFSFQHRPLDGIDTWLHVDEDGVLDHTAVELALGEDPPAGFANVHAAGGDQYAAYLGLAWRLLGSQAVLALPGGDARQCARALHLDGTEVAFEVRVDDDQGGLADPRVVRVSGRSGKNGLLLEIAGWRALCEMHSYLRTDASTYLTLLPTPGADAASSVSRLLGGAARPSVASVVAAAGALVHLVLAVDVGYPNAVWIGASAEKRLQVEHVVREHERCILAYEEEVRQLGQQATWEQYEGAVDRHLGASGAA